MLTVKKLFQFYCVFSLLFLQTERLAITNEVISSEPIINIQMPSVIEDGVVVPVNITVDGISQADPVKYIALKVTSNPVQHQKVYQVNHFQPFNIYTITSRARMAASDSPAIEVTIATNSDKLFRKVNSAQQFKHGADFSDAATLTSSTNGMFKFPSGDIGQQRIKFAPIPTGYEVRGIIHHPMLPAIGLSMQNYINSVDIYLEKQLAAHIDVYDATPNDQVFGIWAGETKLKAKIIWTDTTGRKLEAESE